MEIIIKKTEFQKGLEDAKKIFLENYANEVHIEPEETFFTEVLSSKTTKGKIDKTNPNLKDELKNAYTEEVKKHPFLKISLPISVIGIIIIIARYIFINFL